MKIKITKNKIIKTFIQFTPPTNLSLTFIIELFVIKHFSKLILSNLLSIIFELKFINTLFSFFLIISYILCRKL